MEVENLRRLRNGEQSALSAIYQQYWEELYDLSFQILKHQELAEDAIHDVFVNIWNIRKKMDIQISLKSYLKTCVRYECYRILRRNQKTKFVTIDEESSHLISEENCPIELHELQLELNLILNSLPIKSQIIFNLSRNEELSYIEIAERMNLSSKSVEYHISKVLKKLKGVLKIMTIIF